MKGLMPRLFIFYLFVLRASASNIVSPLVETTTVVATPAKPGETVESVTNQLPEAAKLIRFRRQPPITIIKHVIRSSKQSKPRRRTKRPKTRYGPPSYVYEDQTSYYKPHFFPSKSSETSSFSLDEFPGLHLNAADFELPSSSYEAQSMEFDLYGHSADDTPSSPSISYKRRPPSYVHAEEYGIPEYEPSVEPTYSYKPPARKPHQKYGVPKTYEYSNDFNTDTSYYSGTDYSLYNDYQSQSGPSHSYNNDGSQYPKTKTNQGKNSIPTTFTHIPEEPYGPESHSFSNIPEGPTYDVEPTKPDTYSVYNTKLPNSGYSQTYERPEAVHPPSHPSHPSHPSLPAPPHPPPEPQPQPHPTQSVSDIEITYSPSYEINLIRPNHHNEGTAQFELPDPQNHPGNFAEPPEQHQPLPENNPAPEYHPGPSPNSDTIPGPHFGPGPGPVDYVSPSHELPLNPHHKQPPYDFPKSSYEVPIYDPIPFEASTNDEQEFYPPNLFSPSSSTPSKQHPTSSNDEIPPDTHTSESDVRATSTTKQRRNRKRTRRPSISPIKHILDVPELKEAFEASRATKYSSYSTKSADTEVNASTYVEDKQKMSIIKPSKSSENFFSNDWNPMRVRRPSYQESKDTTTAKTSVIASHTRNANEQHTKRIRAVHRSRQRPDVSIHSTTSLYETTPVTQPKSTSNKRKPTNTIGKDSLVSIEKSRSQSYYDGTLAPSVLTMSNIYDPKLNKFKTPTRLPIPRLSPATPPSPQNSQKDIAHGKRTTKSIFDTTYFQVPQNKANQRKGSQHRFKQDHAELSLPKNHKLY